MSGKVVFKVLNPLTKVIVSVGQMRENGYEVVIGKDSCIRHIATDVYTKVYERGGVPIVPIWIKGISPWKVFSGRPLGDGGRKAEGRGW